MSNVETVDADNISRTVFMPSKRKSFKRISVAGATGMNTRKPSFVIGDQEGNKQHVKIVDIDEEEITPDEIVIPPDGGYGYVIVFAAFMSNVIVDGIVFSFGSIKDSIFEAGKHFAQNGGPELDQATLAWVGSILTGFYLLTGPFVSAAANRFGFRAVAISGSVIASSSFVLSWYLNQNGPKIGLLIIFYGMIGGIGFSCIYVPAVIAVGFYFEKKRAIATGVAICGSGIGNFIFPPFIAILTKNYKWNEAILTLGILILLCAFLGLLYKPLKPQKVRKMSVMTPDDASDETPLLIRIKRARDIMKRWDSVGQVEIGRISFGPSSRHPVRTESHADILSNHSRKLSVPHSKRGSPSTSIRSGGEGGPLKKPLFRPSSAHISSGAGEVISFPEALGVLVSVPTKMSTLQTNGFIGLPGIAEAMQDQPGAEGTDGSPENGIIAESSSDVLNNPNGSRGENSTVLPLASNVRISNSLLMIDETTNPKIITVSSKVALNKPLYRDEILHSGQLLTRPDYANTSMAPHKSSDIVTSPHKGTRKNAEGFSPEEPTVSCFRTTCEVMKSMLDFSLLLSPTFIIFAVSGMFTMMGLMVPFVYLMDQAQFVLTEDNYVPEKSTLTLLLSLIGAANTIGRILSGWIADRPFVNCLILNNGAVTLMGISTVLVPVLKEYFHFIAYACVFGISMACFASLRSILVVELLGLAKLTNAFGLLLLFQGIASMIATPLAGTIVKLSGNTTDFSLAFYVAGGFLLLSAVMSYPLHRIQHWEHKRKVAAVGTKLA